MSSSVAGNTALVEPGGVAEYNPETIRGDFPILERTVHGKPLVYLDNAATTQKPRSVIDAEVEYYSRVNANVHRGIHTLAEEATAAYEATRSRIAQWIGGAHPEEVVFTRGTTEAINLVAQSWGVDNIKSGDPIVLSQMEHHANLVPWIQLAKRTGAELRYIPIDSQGLLELDRLDDLLVGAKLVAVTHMSNVLGTINPVKEIVKRAHEAGAIALVDGAQAAPHLPVDVLDVDADFYAFSAHKMLGPTGIGVLYGRQDLLEVMEPYQTGGEMINLVRWDRATWAELPHKFEAGTPNIAGAVAFNEALEYLERLSMRAIREHERLLTQYCLERLDDLGYVEVFGPRNVDHRGGVLSFEVDGVHPHDLAQLLDAEGVAVRAGHHCAQPLTRLLGRSSTTRASFYVYNTMEEVDRLIEAIDKAYRYFTAR